MFNSILISARGFFLCLSLSLSPRHTMSASKQRCYHRYTSNLGKYVRRDSRKKLCEQQKHLESWNFNQTCLKNTEWY